MACALQNNDKHLNIFMKHTQSLSRQEANKKIKELAKKADVCMFTTKPYQTAINDQAHVNERGR